MKTLLIVSIALLFTACQKYKTCECKIKITERTANGASYPDSSYTGEYQVLNNRDKSKVNCKDSETNHTDNFNEVVYTSHLKSDCELK